MKQCHVCKTTLPDNARFCFNCGAAQVMVNTEAPEVLHFDEALEPQILRLFFMAFRQRIIEEHAERQLDTYAVRLYESGFEEVINRRAEQTAAHIRELEPAVQQNPAYMRSLLDHTFDNLLDYFIIRYCQDINNIRLPEAILSYQGLHWEDIDLMKMTMDYLDFAHETETVYTDFLAMPIEKLKTAGSAFLFPQPQERIFFICDQSLLGSLREGFAMTERALYWRAHLDKARQTTFNALHSLERKKDWLLINGFFFNVNASVNLKVFKLLKKIKGLKQEP
jgi:hypothetical protein